VSVWRQLSAGGLSKSWERLTGGMKYLKENRKEQGRWRWFPFYYTLLAILEIPGSHAISEISYSAPALERMLKRKGHGDRFDLRRRALAKRVLARL